MVAIEIDLGSRLEPEADSHFIYSCRKEKAALQLSKRKRYGRLWVDRIEEYDINSHELISSLR